MHGRGVVRGRVGITLVITNEDMDDIIRIIKSIKYSAKLTDGIREGVKTK